MLVLWIAWGKSSGYSSSICRVLKAFGKHTESFRNENGKHSEKMYSEARLASFEKLHNFRIFKVNRKRSGQCDHTISPNAFRLLSECFQYAFRIDRILPEYRILSAYWFRKVSSANAFLCFPNAFQTRHKIYFELPNTEPNCKYAPRTHQMFSEYDPFAFRSLSVRFPNTKISIRKAFGPV